jgi:DNA-binding transcriptional LysR family regulator
MTPTPSGRFILERAARIVNETEQLRETVRDLRGGRRTSVHLAGTTVAISTFLPAALGEFLADHPEVDLQLDERPSRDIVAAVRAGEIELGIFDGNVATAEMISLPVRRARQ